MEKEKYKADMNEDRWIVTCPHLENDKNAEYRCKETASNISKAQFEKRCSWHPCSCEVFINAVKRDFTKGTRIKLIRMDGEPQMKLGLIGTVNHVDDIGQVHMNWDNGSSLALTIYLDKFEKING